VGAQPKRILRLLRGFLERAGGSSGGGSTAGMPSDSSKHHERETHEQIEDACLYAPLSRDGSKTHSKLAEWRRKHQHEVDKVEGLIKELAKLDPEGASRLTKLKAVHASLETHIREEEQDIFPRIAPAIANVRHAHTLVATAVAPCRALVIT
jgi:hypothetical protein